MDPIGALVNAVPALARLAEGLIKAPDDAKRQGQLVEFSQAVIQFQALIASVQQENATLAAINRDLQAQIEAAKAWSLDKQRYKLVSPYRGAVVYAVLRSMSNGEPPHYLCARCYHEGKPSMLQVCMVAGDKEGLSHFVCPTCKSAARSGYRGGIGMKYAEDISIPE